MSKQTINIGASPNDGTGTPLRTSFDYTNQNFTELYTALGGGVGLPGATTQVIFNDGGTNLAGDAGLVYNKTTDALTVAGLVTAASATITGDLTVDTNVLKVDTTLNRVGIGTASPIAGSSLDVRGAVGTGTDIQSLTLIDTSALAINNGGGLSFGYVFESPNTVIGRAGYIKTIKENATDNNYASAMVFGVTANGASTAERYRIGSDGTSTWSVAGTTAMTLNATGLGIGATPIGKFDVYAVGSDTNMFIRTDTGNSGQIVFRDNADAGNQGKLKYNHSTDTLSLYSAGNENFILNSSGNVGIGITPSAWATATTVWRALDLQYSCGIASSGAGSGEIDFLWNAYYDQTDQRWEFKYTGDRASRYAIGGSGVHTWYNTASTGTANAAITWNPAMTLDASGNLLVGKTSTAATVGGGVVYLGKLDSARDTGDAAIFQHTTLGNTVGSISITAVATAYNIASDYRLKQSVQPLAGGLARVNSLKPSTYKWNLDGSAGEGFIAHELAEVVPFAVSGQKDAVNEDGSIKIQGVDLSKIVPILVAAIQELTAEVNALKNA